LNNTDVPWGYRAYPSAALPYSSSGNKPEVVVVAVPGDFAPVVGIDELEFVVERLHFD